MKLPHVVLMAVVFALAPLVAVGVHGQKHLSEREIASLTPDQRVDEWTKEYLSHGFDVFDTQGDLFYKYIARDGVNAVPRLVQIIEEYDPAKQSGSQGKKRERFEASYKMMAHIDGFSVRLRSSESTSQAIVALEKAIARMKAAGFAKLDKTEAKYNTLYFAEYYLHGLKSMNVKDRSIADTLRYHYEVELSEADLVRFVDFLIARYPDYPGWSIGTRMQDKKRRGPGGLPIPIIVLDKPEKYNEVYKEFCKCS